MEGLLFSSVPFKLISSILYSLFHFFIIKLSIFTKFISLQKWTHFLQKTKKKVANGLQIFMIFVIFLPIPLFIPSFFISVKQQHNHNSQYPEKRSSLYPFPDQLVSISSGKTMNLQIVDSKKTEAVNLVDKVFA